MADDETTELRPFAEFLQEHRRGGALYDASVALQTLVKAIEETGKAGSLTIKLSLKPDTQYGTLVGVTDHISVKLPELGHPASVFYMDGSHNLVRSDPGQLTIPDREREEDRE